MNAKEIFEKRRIQEAGGETAGGQSMGGSPPPSGASSNMRPRPTLRRPPEGLPGDDEEMMMQRMRGMPGGMRGGRPEEMSGPFTASDMSKLKDVLLLIVCQQAGNDYDGGIAQQLMAGKPLDPGQVQHILDESSRVGNIPESHGKVLQKAHEWLQNPGRPS